MLKQLTEKQANDLRRIMKRRTSCRCNCGYSCGRNCGLDFAECINQHYVKDCEHIFDGASVDFENGSSVTCFKCGMLAITHDMKVGHDSISK